MRIRKRRSNGDKTAEMPKPPDMGRLTSLTVLLAGICLGILGNNALEERARIEGFLHQQLATQAVNTGQKLIPLGAITIAPNNTGMMAAKTVLNNAASDGGALCLVNVARTGFICGGNAPDFSFTPTGLAPIWEKNGLTNIRTVTNTHALAVARSLPSGQSVVAVTERPTFLVRLWGPYAAAAIAILALSAAFLANSARLRMVLARMEGERAYFLNRLTAPEFAGCGIWEAKSDSVSLPAALRSALGFPRADQFTSYATLRGAVHPDDLPMTLGLFLGNENRIDGVVRFRTLSQEWQRVYLRATSSTGARFGICVPVGEHATDAPTTEETVAKLRQTLEAIPQAFLLWDQCGRLVDWNTSFIDLFKVNADELKPGLTVRALAKLIAIDTRFLYDFFAPPTLDGGPAEGLFPEDHYMRVIRKRTLGDGWLCIGNDVTDARLEAERRERNERELQMTVDILERSRRDLRDALQQYEVEKHRAENANRAKSEFLANMSHELRTPLNAINGFSELMREELYGPLGHEKYSEYVADIHDSGKHLLNLIDDILDLSKIEAGKIELDLGQLDLERVLREGLRFVDPQMRSSELTLRAMIDHLPATWGDARAVKQIFINLLSNAEKFTPQGGSITVTTLVDLSSVTVLIADTGIGIPADHLDRIGAPFELVEDHFARSRRGSGLGLALSKSLVEAQRGILAIASEVGRGTIASVTLPRREGVTVQLPSMLKNRARILTAPTPENENPITTQGSARIPGSAKLH